MSKISLLRSLPLLGIGLAFASCSQLAPLSNVPSRVAGIFSSGEGNQEEAAEAPISSAYEEVALDGFVIERVKKDQLREVGGAFETQESIRFNKRRRLHGAITGQERADRLGEYFVVDWEGPKEAKNQTVTVRFEYRQRNLGPQLLVKEIQETVTGKEQFTEFAIIGEEYRQGGIATAGKFSIILNGKVVATRHSFLWN